MGIIESSMAVLALARAYDKRDLIEKFVDLQALIVQQWASWTKRSPN